MPTDRATLYRGPATVTRGGVTMYSHSDVVITLARTLFPIETSQHGHIDDRDDVAEYDITFTPAGVIAYNTQLMPYGSTALGASIFGASDTPLTVQTMAGKLYTFPASALVTPPDLVLSAKKTLWGSCTFKAIRTNNTAWSAAGSLVAITDNAFSGTFDPATVVTQPYSAAWGTGVISPPWDAFDTQDGWTISQSLSLDAVPVDADGPIDYTFRDLVVTARAIPIGASEAEMNALPAIQNTGASRGRSGQAIGHNLVITGTGITTTINKAFPSKTGFVFGATPLRQGEVEWMASRTSGTALIAIS